MSGQKITFEILQERFVAGLDRRLEHLDGCLAALSDERSSEEIRATLDDMMRGFHSLAGIGGSYGFHRITGIARLGELSCNALDAPLTPRDVKALGDFVESLRIEACSAAVGVARNAGVHAQNANVFVSVYAA